MYISGIPKSQPLHFRDDLARDDSRKSKALGMKETFGHKQKSKHMLDTGIHIAEPWSMTFMLYHMGYIWDNL